MKFGIFCGAFVALMLTACVQTKQSPLFLTIYQPNNGDTVRTLTNPVSGKTYPGARATIGFALNSPDTTIVPDDSGRFVGTYTIPTDETGPYSVYITVTYDGRPITETRTVNYIHQ
jgi:hypothetical protein